MSTFLKLSPLQRYHVLMDGLAEYAVFLLGLDGNVEVWSRGAERLLGYGKEEILGKHFRCFFFRPEEVLRGEPEHELEMARQRGWTDVERWYSRKDGMAFWGSGITAALRDQAREVWGFIKVLRDLTDKKQMEWQSIPEVASWVSPGREAMRKGR